MSDVKKFLKTLAMMDRSKHPWRLFEEFCEITALALAQPFCRCEKKEKRYLEVITQLPETGQKLIPELFNMVVDNLWDGGQYIDFLGQVFQEGEFSNKFQGQFFTPMSVSRLTAAFSLQDVERSIEKKGFVEVSEPACGSGGMVLAMTTEMIKRKISPHLNMYVVANDVSQLCYHMSYIQLSLAAVPAAVLWANTLSMKVFGGMYTPTYFMFDWHQRLAWKRLIGEQDSNEPGEAELQRLTGVCEKPEQMRLIA